MSAIFNSTFYLQHNADVAAAVASGQYVSAEEHFRLFGQFENRSPSAFFDPNAYLASNPDVAAALSSGQFKTAFEHFTEFGTGEDRDPGPFFNADFYLAANPDIAAAVEAGETTPFEHFLEFGLDEGRDVSPFFDLDGYLAANPDVAAAVAAGQTTAFEHFTEFGYAEGRDLGNGVDLSFFENDPATLEAIADADFAALFARVEEVAPFLPNFEAPAGYTIPANQPIPQGFVPPTGQFLVVPEGVTPPSTALPPAFEQPAQPPVTPEPPTPKEASISSVVVGDGSLDAADLNAGTVRVVVKVDGQLSENQQVFIHVEDDRNYFAKLDAETGNYYIEVLADTLFDGNGTNPFISAVIAEGKESFGDAIKGKYEVTADVKVTNTRPSPDDLGATSKFYDTTKEAFIAIQDQSNIDVTVAKGSIVSLNEKIALTGSSINIWGSGSLFKDALSISGSHVGISGFNFSGLAGDMKEKYSVQVSGDDVRLTANTFTAPLDKIDLKGSQFGVQMTDTASMVSVTSNTFDGGYNVGVFVDQGGAEQIKSLTSISNNTFIGFRDSLGPILVDSNTSAEHPIIRDNDFRGSLSNEQIRLNISNGQSPREGMISFDKSTNNIFPTGSENANGLNITANTGSLIIGSNGNDVMRAGSVVLENPVFLDGGEGNDRIFGGQGPDRLFGSAGNDVINGGSGNDRIVGGVGADTMTGGSGIDNFHFMKGDTGTPSATNFDAITDWNQGTDFDSIWYSDQLSIVAYDHAPNAEAGTAVISSDGHASFHADDDTLAERIAAVELGIEKGGDFTVSGPQAGQFAYFQYGSDTEKSTYFFISDGIDGVSEGDVLVKLVGLAGDHHSVHVSEKSLTFTSDQ